MPRGLPPVGYPVQFFVDGDNQGRPSAAIVTRSYPSGMCDLCELPLGSGNVKQRRSVFMANDPELKRRENWATLYGVWDYVPGMKKEGFVDDKKLAEQEADDKAAADLAQEARMKRAKDRQLVTA